MDFLWVVPVLGVLIIVHEMGHFFAARWLGIKVEEFGIASAARFSDPAHGIDFVERLPIGACQSMGENGESDEPNRSARPCLKRSRAGAGSLEPSDALLIFRDVCRAPRVAAPIPAY